jgi:hypothetical protein
MTMSVKELAGEHIKQTGTQGRCRTVVDGNIQYLGFKDDKKICILYGVKNEKNHYGEHSNVKSLN